MPWARHFSKHLTNMNSFQPHNKHLRWRHHSTLCKGAWSIGRSCNFYDFFFLIYPQTSSDSLLCVPLLYSLGIQNMTFISAWAFLVAPVVKNLPANAGDTRDMGSIPGSGRSPGRGQGNPLQQSCRENPMDRGAWHATVLETAQSWTHLSTHKIQ